jgi:ornithine cyclodeaminase/alanine dehydrogenase-like protein (mu-crystallin family)
MPSSSSSPARWSSRRHRQDPTTAACPSTKGLIGPEHVHAEIGELLAGVRPGRTSADQITLYESVGIAAQDVAAAHLVLTAARAAGLGVEVVL